MPPKDAIRIAPLRKDELPEAGRIMRLAFGTFLGMPDPTRFLADRDMITPRWRSPNAKVLAARDGEKLIGTNVVTRWGSFAFFGPLTILPDYWDRGIAQRLLEATMKVFDRWNVRSSALFTFAHSAKHVGLYQKFGYWPGHLTALMTRELESTAQSATAGKAIYSLLSESKKNERDQVIAECARLTNRIESGLDLTEEIRAVLSQNTGNVLVTRTRNAVDGFAICMHGPGSEGGEKVCYVKFAAARPGSGVANRFETLLHACDWFAASKGAMLEAGINFARADAFRRMRAHGYRSRTQGVAMHRPLGSGFNRPDVYVIDDLR